MLRGKLMKTKPSLGDLTPEQAQRLVIFARYYGRTWKSELNDMWQSGRDANEVDGHLLRQIRNQQGPTWLDKLVI
jgi:hypothetical protein